MKKKEFVTKKVFTPDGKGNFIEEEVTIVVEKPKKEKKESFIKQIPGKAKNLAKNPKKLGKAIAGGIIILGTGVMAAAKIVECFAGKEGDFTGSSNENPSLEDYTSGLLESNQESMDNAFAAEETSEVPEE